MKAPTLAEVDFAKSNRTSLLDTLQLNNFTTCTCSFSENMPLYDFHSNSASRKLTFRHRHLLSKKSWNVYSPAAIARVKRDEAAATAIEAEEERRMQETDAERRLAILRGESPPPLPLSEEVSLAERRRGHRGEDGVRERKRRRLAGEDDTDRDIRLAKANIEDGAHAADRLSGSALAPIVDRDGLMDLFRDDQQRSKKVEKNTEAEAEKAKRERQFEDQYTMRFENAAGRSGFKEKPWYSKIDGQSTEKDETLDEEVSAGFGESKDVWGNPDPRRNERDKTRIIANDPLTVMKRAQQQLRQSENDKRKWQEQRDQETKKFEDEGRYRRSEKKNHKRRNNDSDDPEELSLPNEERTSRRSHRSHQSRESENDNDHNKSHHRRRHGRSRSRSRSRDKPEKRRHRHRKHHSESY